VESVIKLCQPCLALLKVLSQLSLVILLVLVSKHVHYGISQPVMGGHRYDFDTEGEQWAPASNGMWVMIGQKFRNSATTCMTYNENEGLPPPASWGANDGMPNLKKHIMCCRSSL
jgi:hypothetical protein